IRDFHVTGVQTCALPICAYVSLLSLDRQLHVTRETLESRRQALRVAEDRASLGYTSQLELTQAQSEYEATAQLLPQLQQAIRERSEERRVGNEWRRRRTP